MAKRFGPFTWETGNDWASFGGTTSLGLSRTSSNELEGDYGGGQEWVEGTVADIPTLTADAASSLVQIRGKIRFSTLSLTTGNADATTAAGSTGIIYPWRLYGPSNVKLGEWLIWKHTSGAYRMTWVQRCSAGSSIYGTDYEIETRKVYSYVLTYKADTTSGLNRAHILWKEDGGSWQHSSIVQTNTPAGLAEKVSFGSSGSDTGGDQIAAAHDALEVRFAEQFAEMFTEPQAYLILRESSQRTGYGQRANVLRIERELLGAEFEYKREGGCGQGKFQIAAPRTVESWQGNGFRNPDFEEQTAGVPDVWTQDTASGGVIDSASVAYQNYGFNLEISSAGDRAAVYQERAPYAKTLTSGASDTTLPSLAIDRLFRIRCRYRNTSDGDTGGIRIRVVNVTKSLEWSITNRRWVEQSSFTDSENAFAKSFEVWTEAVCEFTTFDGRIQPSDTFRFYIEADDSDGSPVVNVDIGDAHFESWGPPWVYERLRSLDNLSEVELWARREDGAASAHPREGSINTSYERVYSGQLADYDEKGDGSIELRTRGWAQFLKDKLGISDYSGTSIADIVDAEVGEIVDATDGPIYSKNVGDDDDNPTDRIVESFEAEGRSLDSIIRELAELVPGLVSWGVDANREFYFKATPNPYEHDPFNDTDTTLYTFDVERESSAYRKRIDLGELITKVTVLGEKDDTTGVRPSATVECVRATEKYGLRWREVIEQSIQNSGDAAKRAQLILADKAVPRIRSSINLGPTRFREIHRRQSMAPVSIREGRRRGYRMASDGKVYSGGLGASLQIDNSGTQYADFTPTTGIGTSDKYILSFRSALGSVTGGTEWFILGNGSSSGDYFLGVSFEVIVGSPDTLTVRVYAGTSGAPTVAAIVWAHQFANTNQAQTTHWTIVKPLGTSDMLEVYADGGLITPSGGATAFVHGAASGAWRIGSKYSNNVTNGFYGKVDDIVIQPGTDYAAGFYPGTSRPLRSMGEGVKAWIHFDEATEPCYWRDKDGNFGEVEITGATFTNALSTASGTGRKWGEGQTYGASMVAFPERISTRYLGIGGWEQSFELGHFKPSIGTTLDEMDRELEKIREVVK